MNTTQILIFFILLGASCVQGITGFGVSLVAFPLLALLMPPTQAVPLLVAVSLIICLMIALGSKEAAKFSQIRILLLAGVISTPFGALLLKVISPAALSIFAGILISTTSLFLLTGKKIHLGSRRTPAELFIGALSGLLNGSLSMSGPPIIIFMANDGNGKNSIRGNFSLYSFILNIITMASMIWNGLFGFSSIGNFAAAAPAVILGTLAGSAISKKLNERIFRYIILVFLAAMGIWTLIGAICK